MQTITIELRVDFDTATKKVKEPIMLDIARQMAKELVTKAMMIRDRREPTISIQCGDFFSETEDVKLFESEQ